MSDATEEDDAPDPAQAGLRFYTTVCTLALVVVAFVLLLRGMGLWALFPGLAGGLSLVLRWRSGPALFLLCLIWLAVSDRVGYSPWSMIEYVLTGLVSALAGVRFAAGGEFFGGRLREPWPGLDLFLTAAILVYIITHYRLIGVTRNLFPVDKDATRSRSKTSRQRMRFVPEPLTGTRSAELVDPAELGMLFIAATLCATASEILRLWLSTRNPAEDLASLVQIGERVRIVPPVWQLVVLIWLLGVLLLLATGVLGYLAQRRLTPEEAELFLQDELWRQTWREQTRLNRWLAWAVHRQLRKQRRRSTRT